MVVRRTRKVFLIILALLLISLATLILSACSKEESVTKTFQVYKDNWEKQDFKTMYSMLTSKSKEKMSEQQFVDRYTTIYKGIEAQNLNVNWDTSTEIDEKKKETIKIPFTVKMTTSAGELEVSDYEVTFLKEKVNKKNLWKIDWNEKMIFPNMEEGDKVKVETISNKRGQIYDRNGKGLAINEPIVTLGIHPSRFIKNKDANIAEMAKILDIQPSVIENKLKASTNPEQFLPIVNILSTEKVKIDGVMKLEGVIHEKYEGRVYPGGEAFGSLIGYISPITAEELEKVKTEGYDSVSLIGKAGLEQVYEKRLKGQKGVFIYISKQKDGKETQKLTLIKSDSKDGENIKLTVDLDLQKKIYDEMKKDAGASAAVNPKNGEVLALVSSPSYDSNAYTTYISDSQRAIWKASPKDPFINRFKIAYAPGSTFKLITGAIALTQNKINPMEAINIQGLEWQQGGHKVTRVADPHKPVNLQDAYISSDNIYFARAALSIGKEDFVKGSSSFGIGEELPFGYPIAKSQIANGNKISSDALLMDSGFGQGEVLMSPLHMGLIYSSIVNDGNIMTPTLELSSENAAPKVWKEKVISQENAKILRDNLTEVIENPDGTGHAAMLNGIKLAGKTGTAELKKSQEDKTAEENGWFIALNTDNPKIVVTMMIEDVKTRGASHYVVPMVKNVMEYYLKR